MIEIVEMTLSHAYELAKNLREDDRLECEAYGKTPQYLLRKSYYDSLLKKTILIGGKVGACFGLTGSILGSTAHPWLLTSPLVENHYLGLVSQYRREVRSMLRDFPRLESWCDARYTKSLNLLRIVGFHVEEPAMHEKLSVPFCKFWIEGG